MSDGFLGRWSRRKQAVREEGVVPPEPKPVAAAPAATAAPPADPSAAGLTPGTAGGTPARDEAPALTLEDVRSLDPSSDFKPFMARGVTTDVRNAAVKKLFADPRFNVMDRLDIYIDDYSQPDPLPAAMLRQMVSARFLNLVEDEPASGSNVPVAGDDADSPPAADVAQSGLPPELPAPTDGAPTPGAKPGSTDPDDAHTDLRLQPDDAAERQGAGPGPA